MKNDEAQIISIQNKLKNAICEISISDNNKGLGCLVSLPILIENKNHCGILTSNSVLSKTELKVNNVIKLNFKESHKVYDYSIQDKCLLFTCPFLGVSFMEIPDGFIKDIEYLEIQGVRLNKNFQTAFNPQLTKSYSAEGLSENTFKFVSPVFFSKSPVTVLLPSS